MALLKWSCSTYVPVPVCKLVITNSLAVCNILETRNRSKAAYKLHTTVIEVLSSWLVPLNTQHRALVTKSLRRATQWPQCSLHLLDSPEPSPRREVKSDRWPTAAAPRRRYEK